MNGKMAKAIRAPIYMGHHVTGQRMYRQAGNGQIVAVGMRREYLFAKKQIKIMKRQGGYDVVPRT
jgi:hypothetical protein